MTAGKGILHSEMPLQEDGLMRGFQLWVNLPSKHKMTQPRYQEIARESIPRVTGDDSDVKVIAGKYGGIKGAVEAIKRARRRREDKDKDPFRGFNEGEDE